MVFKKTLFLKLGLALGGFILTLLFLELAIRFLSSKQLILITTQPEPHAYYDAVLRWDLEENGPSQPFETEGIKYQIWTNELGCFDTSYNSEKDYVLLVGDSFVFGEAPFETKFGTVLEKSLDIRVLKCGVSGYGTKSELGKAEKTIAKVEKSPRLIIVGYFLNDFGDDFNFQTSLSSMQAKEVQKRSLFLGFPLRTKEWLSHNSALYQSVFYPLRGIILKIPFLKEVFLRLNVLADIESTTHLDEFNRYLDSQTEKMKEGWREHLENIRGFKELADKQGAKLLFVIIPMKFQVYDFLIADKMSDPLVREEYIESANKVIHAALQQLNIPYLDLLSSFRESGNLDVRRQLDKEKDFYYPVDPHWTPVGNQFAGLIVAKYLLENRFVQIQDRTAKLDNIEKNLQLFYPSTK